MTFTYTYDEALKRFVDINGDVKIYRILHLRDAYFLDGMYFKGREAAEQYLHKHLCKVAESKDLPWAKHLTGLMSDNNPLHFEIVEV